MSKLETGWGTFPTPEQLDKFYEFLEEYGKNYDNENRKKASKAK